jgi:hypothetical protein
MRLRKLGIWSALWAAPAALAAASPAAAAPPAKLAHAPVVQDYEPRPAIWLLADEDTKIYLFGTTHMLPPGFRWRSGAVEKVVKEADELVVETVEPAAGSAESTEILRRIMLPAPVPILNRVPKEHRRKLRRAIERTGMPIDGYSHVKTWFAAVMLGLEQQLRGWGVDSQSEAPGVEDGLEADFRAAKKPVGAVETPAAGLDAFDAMSEAEQVKMLLEGLGEEEEAAAAEAEAEDNRAWATGRFEDTWESFIKDFPPVLYDGLVTKRNAAWTLWLEERLKKPGTVLFAVGAGHLAGPDSVQKMLAKRGLEAKRFD